MHMPTLELDVDPEWGQHVDWEALAAHAAGAAASVAPELARSELLVSVVLSNDDEVQALNRQWRAKDRPTNVLSFPMISREELLKAEQSPGQPVMLGDVIMAFGVCSAEAADKGVVLAEHATHLLVHGLLHLAGYDHETGASEAESMEKLEIAALATIGISDPYADHDPTCRDAAEHKR
ncbi:rRNA maturation RNase YbeY [Croceicoccus sp. F390]|uniref:Endoribonuclease YbeY n=1 Tax=Croceicoccus esteveae TaxID=3075597 RepID=A0ABU2ZDV0_9SPHN|nr:rRNA maturation RNase YbeY [Croceicoccus sp. F390]MDT0574777.1 rRNA maturation RNase YbeY [Croceicoccus sp. F390]